MENVSVIVTALNEETNLKAAVLNIVKAVERVIDDYEIIIIDDGSTDKTGAVARMLCKKNKKISWYRNEKNMGIGYSYKRGVQLAKKEYVVWIPGDDELVPGSLTRTLRHIGEADLIIPYMTNKHVRTIGRIFISDSFVAILNLLFHLDIKYYNAYVVLRRKLVHSVGNVSNGFTYMAEIVVILAKRGHSYIQVPGTMKIRKFGQSNLLKPKNVIGAILSLLNLIYRVYFKKAR